MLRNIPVPGTLPPMTTVEQAIGAEVRRLREADGARQEQLAAAARRFGLRWSQATIAAVELGRRKLSLGEVALLPLVLAEALGRPDAGARLLDVAELIPDENQVVDVAPGLRLPLGTVRMLFGGRSQSGAQPVPRAAPPELEDAGAAERKAARTLGVSPHTVAVAAQTLWGHSLAEERDHRLGAPAQFLARRSLQARRGRVTRRLMQELAPIVRAGKSRRRPR
jgi:transcriptional regulator with XRE-family HTH domain